MKHTTKFSLFNIGLFFLILSTANAWISWSLSSMFVGLVRVLILFLGLSVLSNYKNQSRKNIYVNLAVLFLTLSCLWQASVTILGLLGVLVQGYLIWVILSLSTEAKAKIIKIQTYLFTTLITISLIYWLLHFVVSLPSFGVIYRAGYDSLESGCINYLFFIESAYHVDIRFHSVFLEPGHLGTMIPFFLMANRFDFHKKSVILLTITLLFTLSLAGYTLFFVGYLLCVIAKRKDLKLFIGIFFLTICIALSYSVAKTYNGGSNYVNDLIVSRLIYDDKDGFSGDNRSTSVLDKKFDAAITDGTILTGISTSAYISLDDTSAGIKAYLLEKGIIGVLFILLGYFYIAKISPNKKWAMLMLILYIVSSYQRTYFMWYAYLIPFICGSVLSNDNLGVYNNKQ